MRHGHTEVLQALMTGAHACVSPEDLLRRVNAADADGASLLHCAAKNGHVSCVLLLIKARRLRSIGLHWIALDGLHWIALDCIGMHWIALDCIGLHWIAFHRIE